MATICIETDHSFVLADRAYLLDDKQELAWAEKFIVPNPANAFVIGKYVEADNANSNRQYFSLDGLRMAKPTLTHAPMDINHSARRIVGSYVASELVWPTNGENEDLAAGYKPFIEALGVVWKARFPDEYRVIEEANSNGTLYFSMEAVGSHLECTGSDAACGAVFPYQGPRSPAYCDHLNNPQLYGSVKHIINPHFTGGALIVPPEKPGWSSASVTQMSALVREQLEVASEETNLTVPQWEYAMSQLLEVGRHFIADHKN